MTRPVRSHRQEGEPLAATIPPAAPPERREDKGARPCALAGLEALADRSGALFLPSESTLLVADLHLEKGSAFAARGQPLPPYDTAATLERLAEALARWSPRRVIALGDSWHDKGGPSRLGAADRAALAALQAGRDWLWITGNHDPDPAPAALGLPGDVAAETSIGAVRLVHEPSLAPGCEIAGHLHPVAAIRPRGRRLRRRCFALSATRIVLPAFGAYAGGLNLTDPAFRPLFPGAFQAYLLGQADVFVVGHRLLQRD